MKYVCRVTKRRNILLNYAKMREFFVICCCRLIKPYKCVTVQEEERGERRTGRDKKPFCQRNKEMLSGVPLSRRHSYRRRWDGSRTRPFETEFRHAFRLAARLHAGNYIAQLLATHIASILLSEQPGNIVNKLGSRRDLKMDKQQVNWWYSVWKETTGIYLESVGKLLS